jgi:hypothetical protein
LYKILSRNPDAGVLERFKAWAEMSDRVLPRISEIREVARTLISKII